MRLASGYCKDTPVALEDLVNVRARAASVCARMAQCFTTDKLQGMNDWRNIQDVVRMTFKAFHDVLRAQGDAIKNLERVVDAKANRKEVSAALASKASAADVCAQLNDTQHLLCLKADTEVPFPQHTPLHHCTLHAPVHIH